MTYLTNAQARRVNASNLYAPRKLTPLELVVKQVVGIHSTPVRDAMVHAGNIREVLRNLQSATDNHYLAERITNAVNDPKLLREVVQSFPYVEFEDVIAGEKLQGLELAAQEGITYAELEAAVTWLDVLHDLIKDLPRGVNAFVGTPRTSYANMHLEHTQRKRKECLGLVLTPELQKSVNEVFDREQTRKYRMVKRYLMINGCDVVKVFGVDVSSKIKDVQVHLDFNDQRIGHPVESVLTVTLQQQEQIIGTYHFVI